MSRVQLQQRVWTWPIRPPGHRYLRRMRARTNQPTGVPWLVMVGVLLLAASVLCLQQADAADGWSQWSWRIVGVVVGVSGVNVLVAQVRRGWARGRRHGRPAD